MANIKKLLGARIKELRKKRGLTQEKMAELIEISPPSVSKIESGIYHPTEENIKKIAEVLNVEIFELYKFNQLISKEDIKDKLHLIIDSLNEKDLKLAYKLLNSLLN